MTYTIKIPHFEGPFDLLLFFIERDELDIYDIPIAKITDDFFDYLKEMKRLNIDLASEFILVAATLMRIKAKMLLPRKPVDEEGNEIDPREELVQQLLEYKRYKEVIAELRELEEERKMLVARGNVAEENKLLSERALIDIELQSLTLYNLMKSFRSVLEDYQQDQLREVHTIFTYHYTIEEQQYYVLNRLSANSKCDFGDLFSFCENRIHAIVTFLALLELLNQQKITVLKNEGVNSFSLALKSGGEEE